MVDTRDAAALDEALLERLYVKLEARMVSVVYRWVWSAEEAQDITQDAFMKVWSMRDRVEVETVEALLYRTAVNLAANRRRKRRLWGLFGLDSVEEPAATAPGPDEGLDAARWGGKVRAAVDALPEKLRCVVVLAELSELPYAEIGAILEIPEGTVASRRNTAMKRLAEALGGLETTEERSS
jgi:RNA polymerase sigma-70 factor (ECF subfamily)